MDYRGGFPWLSASQLPDLFLFTPHRREDGAQRDLPPQRTWSQQPEHSRVPSRKGWWGMFHCRYPYRGGRRSGVYSIMLNLKNQQGLDNALLLGNAMTPGEWYQHIVRVSGLHLLPANPKHRSPLPSWAEYYQLLQFSQKQYDYLLMDLQEVVNEATAAHRNSCN
jgi:hypothetical protein